MKLHRQLQSSRASRATGAERGTILLVVLIVATAIAALAAISSGRAVAETRHQLVLEDESRANNEAFSQLHLALNVINNSAYNDLNHNLELRASIAGDHGGTTGGEVDDSELWLRDPVGVEFGLVRGTGVRVYLARDYIKRLKKIKGQVVPAEVDPGAQTDNYFILEALGRAGDTVRAVSALVRENEPFSSFVFFQNRHPLGVSGAPRGLIHSNDRVDFYFPKGDYADSVTAANGFGYEAGATEENTRLTDANPEAATISLEAVNFQNLRDKADLFVGDNGMDAEIRMYPDGRVRIRQYTPPRHDWVPQQWTENVLVDYDEVIVTEIQQVQVGTTQEERTRQIITGYETEFYTVTVPVYEDQEVTHTRWIPVYELQTVTRTRWIQVFVPYDTDAEGGTAVGGDGGDGVPGEYEWVEEEYETEENVIVRWDSEEYTEIEPVQVGTVQEERSRQVPIYEPEIYWADVPVYEDQEVQVTQYTPVYEERSFTEDVWTFFPPVLLSETTVDLNDAPGTIYIDGRITELEGELKGRLTVVGNEKVRVTGSIRYMDDSGNTAMVGGGDYTADYERNPEYTGNSTLGVIARDDVLLTDDMPSNSEINATLMSVEGRVGIDGIAIDEAGEPTEDWRYGMTDEERAKEEAYQNTDYETRRFTRDSLRRIGGIISNDRIVETLIRSRSDGTSYVRAGFKRGRMKFDVNLMFNPPPNFVEVPRPVLAYYAPVFFVRNQDD